MEEETMRNIIKSMPIGAIYQANRYDNDNEHVLHLWVSNENIPEFGQQFDIRFPKEDEIEIEHKIREYLKNRADSGNTTVNILDIICDTDISAEKVNKVMKKLEKEKLIKESKEW
jgi:hypothetical protein